MRRLNDGFRQLVKALALDYLLIDTHPGLSKETFLTIAISHCLLLILRPDKQDYQGTAVTLDVARQLNVRHVQLVINKVFSTLEPIALRQKVEETYGIPVAGLLPLSEDIVQLASEGGVLPALPPTSYQSRVSGGCPPPYEVRPHEQYWRFKGIGGFDYRRHLPLSQLSQRFV